MADLSPIKEVDARLESDEETDDIVREKGLALSFTAATERVLHSLAPQPLQFLLQRLSKRNTHVPTYILLLLLSLLSSKVWTSGRGLLRLLKV